MQAFGSPDFTVTSITLNPAAPYPGQSFTATVRVKNVGDAPNVPKGLAVWLNKSSFASCRESGRYDYRDLPLLAVGQEVAVTFNCTAPSQGCGGWYFRAYVNPECVFNGDNNRANDQVYKIYGTCPPDFVVTSINLNPANPGPGQAYTATVTVKNQGGISGDARVLYAWKHSPSSRSCGSVGDYGYLVGTLAPGATKSYNFYFYAPTDNGSCPWTFRAYVDAICETYEGSNGENNNQATRIYGTCCSYGIDPSSKTFPAGGGTDLVMVYTLANCSWTATANASWITITDINNGIGDGGVTFRVSPNSSTSSRTGTMTIAGQTFTVTQAGVSCTYGLTPASRSFTSSGGPGTISVTTSSGCGWTASDNASWITITSGSDTGNGTVTYSVAANTSTSSRTGQITVQGQTHTVTQPGIPCSYSLTPSMHNFSASAGSGWIDVWTGSGCSWRASDDASWITITSDSSGSGNGTVGFSVAANTSTSSRTGHVSVEGQTHTVTQAGALCTYLINPTSASYGSGGGSGSVSVTAGSGCSWAAASSASWITITGGSSGTGNGTVSYSVAANGGASARTGHITLAGQTHTVTEAGVSCTYSISPTSASYSYASGSGTVSVTAGTGCSWTADSGDSWISITSSGSGTGNGTVNYAVAANSGTSLRTGTMTIAGKTFTVTQAGESCDYSISPPSRTFTASSGPGTISVSAGSGCSWTATKDVTWITITGGSSGTGNGTVSYSVAVNGNASARTGHITIQGQTHTVNQSGSVNGAYALTAGSYVYTADLQGACQTEFGSAAQVADWAEIKAVYGGSLDSIRVFCDQAGLTAMGDTAWVLNNGQGLYSSTRHYLVARHEGTVPVGWAVHDHIQSHFLDLGSWSGSRRVLVKTSPTTAPTRIIGLSGNLAFGNVQVGQTATRTLTITNSGNSTLNVTSITYPAGFSGAWSGSIASGGSHDVTVTFAPTAVTSYGGTVTVNSDATGGTNTMALSGSGVTPPPETQRPTLRITSPTSGQRWSNAVFIVSGTASDNVGVTSVRCQLNGGGGWTNASSANGWTNWTATVSLNPGTNVVRAYAADAAGNTSLTNSVSFVHVVTSQLTLRTNGAGTITVNGKPYVGQMLEVGKAYTAKATAVPRSGQVFSNWTGSVSSSSATLNFLMQSNMVLEANFIPIPFPAAQGTYNGLFYETNRVSHHSSGFFSALTTSKGTFSAKLQLAGRSYALAGRFADDGTASGIISRKGLAPISVQLKMDPSNNMLAGEISDGTWTANLFADRATFDAKANPAPEAGKYTLIIPGHEDSSIQPGGDGFGTVTVNASGKVTFSGTLADGTKVSQKTALSKDGQWPFYNSLYSRNGSIVGWLNFTNRVTDDINGLVSWIKLAQPTAKFYPAGFTNETEVVGSTYRAIKGTPVLNFSMGQISLADGNLPEAVVNQIALGADNKVTNLSSNKLNLQIMTSSGLFRGAVVDRTTGERIPFKGAVLQKQNLGAGYFLGTSQSGRVCLGP